MRCHVCNVAVGDGQRFCHECGQSLKGVTDPTEPLPALSDETSQGEASDAHAAVASDATGSAAADPQPSSTDSDLATPARGELPDFAATPDDSIDVRDESWWSSDGATAPGLDDAPPAPTEPIDVVTQPPTEPIDVVTQTPTERVDETTRPVTEPTAADTSTTRLDVVAPDRYADTGATHAVEHEATTTMPVMTSRGSRAGVVDTDEFTRTHSAGDTAQMPIVVDGAHPVEYGAPLSNGGFRLRITVVLSLLAVVAAVMVTAADVIDIRTSRPVDGIIVGLRELDSFGSNLAVAGLVGTGLMMVGALASCFGQRWGAGLAGGSGLATLGWAAMTLGLVEVPINSAQQITQTTGIDVGGFTLAITRDIGWFLIVAIGAVGFVVFIASLRLAGTGGRSGLNPWIAALGALGTVIVAAGPLIPLGVAVVRDNLGTADLPREFFAARLVQVGLVAFGGVVGFLSVRTYGLGLVAGSLGVSGWLWITSFAEYGDRPVGIGVGNVGVSNTMPHAVTSVGVAASLVMLAVASTMALLGHTRR